MVPLPSLRDVSLDLDMSAKSGATGGGTAALDSSGWVVTTGGSRASPTYARSDTPGLTAGLASTEGGAIGSVARLAPWALLAVLGVALLMRGR